MRGSKATQAVAVAEVDDGTVEAEEVGAEPQPMIRAASVNKSAAPVARLNSRNASIAVSLLLDSLFGCFSLAFHALREQFLRYFDQFIHLTLERSRASFRLPLRNAKPIKIRITIGTLSLLPHNLT